MTKKDGDFILVLLGLSKYRTFLLLQLDRHDYSFKRQKGRRRVAEGKRYKMRWVSVKYNIILYFKEHVTSGRRSISCQLKYLLFINNFFKLNNECSG